MLKRRRGLLIGNIRYLTLNVNSFFLAKSQIIRSSEGMNEKLPIKKDEEFSLVDNRFEISNHGLLKDMFDIIGLTEILPNS
jgi:hypothetical protein